MKKVLGIVLLVLALTLVSVPAFAQKAELSLKYWHAGVGGADLWVGDYGEYDEHEASNGSSVSDYVFSTEKLVLQPGAGGSFILSGSYFLSPSTSVGISYWGLSRAGTVGVDLMATDWKENGTDYYGPYSWFENDYLLRVPWWDRNFLVDSDRWEYVGDNYHATQHYDEALLIGEGSLSMSALDISGMKALTGPDWEVALSGGIRRATFSQNQLTALDFCDYRYEYECEEDEYYHGYEFETWNFGLDSELSVSAIGPQVGIEGKYALGDKLMLKAGAKAGVLFGTATADATWTADHVYSEAEWEGDTNVYEDEWRDSIKVSYPATDSIQIATYDLSASLGYQITEQWSVEAGYYVSLWKGVPSLYVLKCNDSHSDYDGWYLDPRLYDYLDYYYDDFEDVEYSLWAWEQPEPRDIVVSGLTVGVNYKF